MATLADVVAVLERLHHAHVTVHECERELDRLTEEMPAVRQGIGLGRHIIAPDRTVWYVKNSLDDRSWTVYPEDALDVVSEKGEGSR